MGGGRGRVVGDGGRGFAGHCVTVWELDSVRALVMMEGFVFRCVNCRAMSESCNSRERGFVHELLGKLGFGDGGRGMIVEPSEKRDKRRGR